MRLVQPSRVLFGIVVLVLRPGGGSAVSDPRQRSSLWRTILASGQDVGHPGSRDCASLAVAKRVCRAGNWVDSMGMSRPCRGDRRTASAADSVEVRRLQRDPDTLILGQGRTEVPESAAAERGKCGEGAARRWTPSRIPATRGVSRWTNKWKAQGCFASGNFQIPPPSIWRVVIGPVDVDLVRRLPSAHQGRLARRPHDCTTGTGIVTTDTRR